MKKNKKISLIIFVFCYSSFAMVPADLNERINKAQRYCLSEQALDNMAFKVVNNDSVLTQIRDFQEGPIVEWLHQKPMSMLNAIVRSRWPDKWEDHSGTIAKNKLMKNMSEQVRNRGMNKFQKACMASCVTRVMVKPLHCINNYSMVFSPTEETLSSGQGPCSEIVHVFENFANELEVPTISYVHWSGLKSSLFLILSVSYLSSQSFDAFLTGFLAIANGVSMPIGHYTSRLLIDRKYYAFDPLRDYDFDHESRLPKPGYQCTFHEQ